MNPPQCTTCGYAVEWLRSCYDSSWRLYAGRPDLLVRGYYYYSHPNTPHYPGLHQVWSGTWVHPELIDPDLGEASGPRHYRRGDVQVVPPPAVRLGAASCISDGDDAEAPPADRQLIAGIDSRCWAVPPVPPPLLWYRASRLHQADGSQVHTWPQESYLGKGADALDGGLGVPRYSTAGPPGGQVVYVSDTPLTLSPPVQLPAQDYVLLVAARGDWTGLDNDTLRACLTLAGRQGCLVVERRTLETDESSGVVRVAAPYDLTGAYRLYWVRRRGQQVTLGLGTTWDSGPQPVVPSSYQIDSPCTSLTQFGASLTGRVLEVRLYDSALPDDAFAAARQQLIATYSLVP